MRTKAAVMSVFLILIIFGVAVMSGCDNVKFHGGKGAVSTVETATTTEKATEKPTKKAEETRQTEERPDKNESASAKEPETTTAAKETSAPETTAATTATTAAAQTQPAVNLSIPTGPESGSPYDNHGKLSVSGTHLVDESGAAYQLRGVSTHGIGWFPQYVNYDAFLTLRDDWGANCVRIAMYTAEGGYCETDDNGRANLMNIVDTGVEAATKLGMYAIIDWHVLNDRDPNRYIEQAKSFFATESAKYSGYGNVIYEICNEPNGGVGWSQIKSYAEIIIPIIKANAPDAIIVVGTPTWSQDVEQAAYDPITGYSNIMYTLHFYADTHKEFLRNKMEEALSYGIPLFVTEFGICDASGNGANNKSEGNTWIEKLDSYGISYCIWNLANKAESSSLISTGCNKTGYWTPGELSDSGNWYRDVLRARMGITADITATIPSAANRDNQNNQQPQTEAIKISGAESENSGLAAKANVTGGWNDGKEYFYQLGAGFTNNSGADKEDWVIRIEFDGKINVSQNWNCSVVCDGNVLTVSPAEYNKKVMAGQSLSDIGIIVSAKNQAAIIAVSAE